jgi:hypothetical protein
MRAVAMVVHVRLRQHWRSWLALAALVALVGGFVIAASATGRRTAAAFPGFVARTVTTPSFMAGTRCQDWPTFRSSPR